MRLVTAMSSAQHARFGEKMIRSVARYWPRDMLIDLWSEDEELDGFLELTDYVEFRKMGEAHRRPGWKYDQRFAAKVFALTSSALRCDGGVLVWLDADTLTRKHVTAEVIEEWLPPDKALAYLGRQGSTSECGVVLYRLDSPKVRAMLAALRAAYTSGDVFSLPEWHDSYVFDVMRRAHVPEALQHNLSPGGRGYEHVFEQSPVGEYIEHAKGPRRKARLDSN